MKVDPFQVLDQNGVGQLVRMATEKGRAIRPDLKCGICGEHGGEPSSVKFCHRVGLNYVSCSPFRVPIARLAAAQSNTLVRYLTICYVGCNHLIELIAAYFFSRLFAITSCDVYSKFTLAQDVYFMKN